MLILGIDPGSRKTGYAVIRCEQRRMEYITSGVLRFDHIDDFLLRLGEVHKAILELVDSISPEEIAFESLIYVKNPSSMIKLSQTRGAMLGPLSEKYAGKVFEYSPNLVKSSVTGHGHANKKNVQKALEMIFGKTDFKTDDESDALAIAVCHGLNRGRPQLSRNQEKLRQGRSGGRTLKEVFRGMK